MLNVSAITASPVSFASGVKWAAIQKKQLAAQYSSLFETNAADGTLISGSHYTKAGALQCLNCHLLCQLTTLKSGAY